MLFTTRVLLYDNIMSSRYSVGNFYFFYLFRCQRNGGKYVIGRNKIYVGTYIIIIII